MGNSFKTLAKLVLIGTLNLACLSGYAKGGSDGGGGGLIVVNGQLQLVTEAGLRIKDSSPAPYALSAQTIGGVDQLISYLDLDGQNSSSLKESTIGSADTFKKANSIDKNLEAKIKAAYSSVAQESGMNIPPELIVLAAYSDQNTTYILPAFDKLKPLQQAKVLLHEADYRHMFYHPSIDPLKMKSELKSVLKIDVAVEDLLRDLATTGTSNKRVGVDAALGVSNLYHVIQALEVRLGRRVRLDDLSSGSDSFLTSYSFFDSAKVATTAAGDYDMIKTLGSYKLYLDVRAIFDPMVDKCMGGRGEYDECAKQASKALKAMTSNACFSASEFKGQNIAWFLTNETTKQVWVLNCATQEMEVGYLGSKEF